MSVLYVKNSKDKSNIFKMKIISLTEKKTGTDKGKKAENQMNNLNDFLTSVTIN